ncbi:MULTISPECIES: hypothetical protein [Mycobacterium]|jgi:hypothetical protein|uniref:Uncharacterized protein n=2 Tax=Mycobacterium TaxID=1763 RepID=D5P2X7_9MYCO|nr:MULTISPECIES: hypothetical protein [Mycobacterium]EFG79544.1 hypothetical protein HMPREF0591_0521 [Mycobacterium parascrofulaceum ATCC BAA-614]
MPQPLRVNSAALQAMATRWGAWVGDLHLSAPSAALGLSCQASAAAVLTAHIEVDAFMAALSAQVRARAAHVTEADSRYNATEVASAQEEAAVVPPQIRL